MFEEEIRAKNFEPLFLSYQLFYWNKTKGKINRTVYRKMINDFLTESHWSFHEWRVAIYRKGDIYINYSIIRSFLFILKISQLTMIDACYISFTTSFTISVLWSHPMFQHTHRTCKAMYHISDKIYVLWIPFI